MNIEQTIRNYIINERFRGKVPGGFDDDYNLIDEGVLDSLAIINLVSYLEQQYQIEFGDNDIVPEHFSSVNTLFEFVREKLE